MHSSDTKHQSPANVYFLLIRLFSQHLLNSWFLLDGVALTHRQLANYRKPAARGWEEGGREGTQCATHTLPPTPPRRPSLYGLVSALVSRILLNFSIFSLWGYSFWNWNISLSSSLLTWAQWPTPFPQNWLLFLSPGLLANVRLWMYSFSKLARPLRVTLGDPQNYRFLGLDPSILELETPEEERLPR